MTVRIDHVGIAVRSIAERLAFWRDALGIEVVGTERVLTEGVDVAFLQVGEARVELLEPVDDASPIARSLEKRGEGIHHLTLAVGDIVATLDRLRQRGIETVGEAPRPGAGGSRVAFLHPRSCGGILLEIVERPPRRAARAGIGPGDAVLAYLRDPQEKLFGLVRSLDAAGVVLEGIDLASFDDWLADVERGGSGMIAPSVLFLPMARVERLMLDRSSGDLPSLSERFRTRVGRTVGDVLGS